MLVVVVLPFVPVTKITLYPFEILDKMLLYFKEKYKEKQVDYLSNTIKRTYPRGYDIEIFTFSSLEKSYINAKKEYEREHVTPYLYTNAQKVYYDRAEKDYSGYRLTLDTEEDLNVITQIITALYNPDKVFHLEDIIQFLDANPAIWKINSNIKQKEI